MFQVLGGLRRCQVVLGGIRKSYRVSRGVSESEGYQGLSGSHRGLWKYQWVPEVSLGLRGCQGLVRVFRSISRYQGVRRYKIAFHYF